MRRIQAVAQNAEEPQPYTHCRVAREYGISQTTARIARGPLL